MTNLTEAEIREIREACNRLTPYHDVNRRDGFYDLAEKALPRLLDERETLLKILQGLLKSGFSSNPAVHIAARKRAVDYLIHKGETKP